MPKFKVEARSAHPAEKAFEKIKGLLENDKELRRMDADYRCEFDGQKLTGRAKGGKFEADLRVSGKDTGSVVEIEVSLPLLLTPVKGVVQSTLQKKLDAALA